MATFISKAFSGKHIRINSIDHYVCLTDMAKATGRKVNDFLRLDNTQDFINELSSNTGYPAIELLIATAGNTGKTWAHPQIAIKFAGWLSPAFEVLMTSWIFELLSTRKVELEQPPEPKIPLFADEASNNMATAIAPSLSGTASDSAKRSTGSDSLTVTEMLELLGHLREEGSIAMNIRFRNWLNKDLSGLYRSQNGTRPPQAKKRGCPYCYPPAYIPVLETYLKGYATGSNT